MVVEVVVAVVMLVPMVVAWTLSSSSSSKSASASAWAAAEKSRARRRSRGGTPAVRSERASRSTSGQVRGWVTASVCSRRESGMMGRGPRRTLGFVYYRHKGMD